MTKRFRQKKVKKSNIIYSYKPKDTSLLEERAVYQRLILVIIFVSLFSIILYVWGIQIVVKVSSLWNNFSPSDSTKNPNNILTTSDILLPPNINSLPTAINNLGDFKIVGQAKPGDGIAIFINDQKVKEVLADASGNFEVTGLTLFEGENKIYAKILTPNEQTSKPSKTQTVVFDKTPPELEVTEPPENAEFEGKEEKWLTVSGTTEPGATVLINDHQAIVDLEGNFRQQYILSIGDNLLKIVSRDEAGNETIIERTIKYSSQEAVTPTIPPFLTPSPTPE